MAELVNLSLWYGESKIGCMNEEESSQPPYVNPVMLKLERKEYLPVYAIRILE